MLANTSAGPVCNLSSIWMSHYTTVALQLDASVLLAAEGLALSWSGPVPIFSLNSPDDDFVEVAKRLSPPAGRMKQDAGVARRFPHHNPSAGKSSRDDDAKTAAVTAAIF